MPQNTKPWLVTASLLAFPLLTIVGCGGGGGGVVSPTPTALPGSLPTATPNATAAPTSVPVRASYLLNATFTNRNADVPTNFSGTDGQGSISDAEAPTIGYLGINFLQSENEEVDFSFNSLGKIKTGDVITLTNKFPINDGGLGFVLYSNYAKKQQYIAKSGTLKINSIATFPVDFGTATKVAFTISNAQMVPNTGGTGNSATGSFTLNATGSATIPPP